MSTRVNIERSRLHEEYARLRVQIIRYYLALPLVGREPDPIAYKIPPKLGHWSHVHSARVLDACPELAGLVHAVEALSKQRDKASIIARVGVARRGGWKPRKRHWRHPPELAGEWPSKKHTIL